MRAIGVASISIGLWINFLVITYFARYHQGIWKYSLVISVFNIFPITTIQWNKIRPSQQSHPTGTRNRRHRRRSQAIPIPVPPPQYTTED